MLEKAKDRYHDGADNEKTPKYYEDNKEVIKENARNKNRNLSKEEKKQEAPMEEINTETCQR